MSKGSPHTVLECAKLVDTNKTSIQELLGDLQMKYKDTMEGLNLESYLYSTASKLALVKNFRDEALSLVTKHAPEVIRAAPVCIMRDVTSSDQFKHSYRLSNLPMNPTQFNS